MAYVRKTLEQERNEAFLKGADYALEIYLKYIREGQTEKTAIKSVRDDLQQLQDMMDAKKAAGTMTFLLMGGRR